ncbi:hypothetical protein PVAND_008264 [Polypedilum vanderplanki]|uniref:Chitin-binding type-2 domain-containing protein n=1 Tax=Polypedilum vanderplanki TaxID=319348 RepID=A0A9J6CA14_POLVA|nr:hypothetical protein PVAND_008264 [Polypedilum vanderplanki]
MKFIIVIILMIINSNLINCANLPICEPNTVSWHPHPYACDLFYMCFWGELILRSCAPGLHYNRNTTQCMLPELAGCEFQTEINCPTPDNPNQILFQPDPNDCSKYYVCHNGNPIARECATNFFWDINNKWCTFPDQVTCDSNTINNPNDPNRTTQSSTTTVTTTTLPTTTRNPNTFDCPLNPSPTQHPHTRDCWRFFICINGVAFLRDCGYNLLFDTVTSNCAPYNEAVCYPGSSSDR